MKENNNKVDYTAVAIVGMTVMIGIALCYYAARAYIG